MNPVRDLVSGISGNVGSPVYDKSREIVLETVNVWIRAFVQASFNEIEDPIIDSTDFVYMKMYQYDT